MVEKLTDVGFFVTKLPNNIWELILWNYRYGSSSQEYVENDPNGLDGWIKSDKHRIATNKIEYPEGLKHVLLDMIKPYLEQFSGKKLKDGLIYHIRTYLDGAKLFMHQDNEGTHHVGANITIDYDCENWPFHILDHDGNEHKIYTEPGDVVFYEASRLSHGRPTPLNGSFYTNTYMHFKVDE
jgi:prolyl 4-hydroxylase